MTGAQRGSGVTELVERAQHGDREAFDALARAMYDRLYSIGQRILRDGHAAEDAVQETLIRGWRDLRSLRDPSKFDAWIHRLLINACHDQSRSARRMEAKVTAIGLDREDPRDENATVAHRDEIERAFLRLPVEHRAVLVLLHYVGLPAPQVSQILGIPPGTVYSRNHYALRTMREAISVNREAASAAPVREHAQ
jgi:RNA polymerase sigma-70 factor, ECF subfamily